MVLTRGTLLMGMSRRSLQESRLLGNSVGDCRRDGNVRSAHKHELLCRDKHYGAAGVGKVATAAAPRNWTVPKQAVPLGSIALLALGGSAGANDSSDRAD